MTEYALHLGADRGLGVPSDLERKIKQQLFNPFDPFSTEKSVHVGGDSFLYWGDRISPDPDDHDRFYHVVIVFELSHVPNKSDVLPILRVLIDAKLVSKTANCSTHHDSGQRANYCVSHYDDWDVQYLVGYLN